MCEQGDSGKDNLFTDPDVKVRSPEPRAAVQAGLPLQHADLHACLCELVWNCT